MECSEPGAIRDEELLAYLAGENVRPLVIQHLARCQRCTSQLAAYKRIERTLTSKLYRFDCPPGQVLGEFQLGLLSKELTAAVNNHLSICALCTAEVATLTEFLAQPAVARDMSTQTSSPNNNHRSAQGAKSILERLQNTANSANTGARRIIATLLPPQPRLAFQRDTTQLAVWPRRYIAEDVSISVQVERDASQRDSLQLIGFVTRQGKSLNILQGTQVLLTSQAVEVSHDGAQYTQEIDELGNFVFSSIVPTTYTLELQLPGSNVVIEQLPVTLQS